MNIPEFSACNTHSIEEEDRTVVRVTTSYYSDKRGIHKKRSLLFMKRLSKGWNSIQNDCSAIGERGAVEAVINFEDVEDGLYEVMVVNITHDYETGYVDYWDYKLVPYSVSEP